MVKTPAQGRGMAGEEEEVSAGVDLNAKGVTSVVAL